MGAWPAVLRRCGRYFHGGYVALDGSLRGSVMMWQALTQEGKAAVSVFILIVEAWLLWV